MADIPGALSPIQIEEVDRDSPVAEVTLTRIGANINELINRLQAGFTAYLSPGTFNFTTDDATTRLEIFGSGGGQAGLAYAQGQFTNDNGAPGGAGAVPFTAFVDVTPNTTYQVIIGAGGTPVSSVPVGGVPAGDAVYYIGGAGGNTIFGPSLVTFYGAPAQSPNNPGNTLIVNLNTGSGGTLNFFNWKNSNIFSTENTSIKTELIYNHTVNSFTAYGQHFTCGGIGSYFVDVFNPSSRAGDGTESPYSLGGSGGGSSGVINGGGGGGAGLGAGGAGATDGTQNGLAGTLGGGGGGAGYRFGFSPSSGAGGSGFLLVRPA